MAGTFVATPSKALTIEHEPTGRAMTQFKPEEARADLNKVEVLARYGVNLRDDTKLFELAVKKLEILVDIVDWVNRFMRSPVAVRTSVPHYSTVSPSPFTAENSDKLSQGEVMETLGYSTKSFQLLTRWRQLVTQAKEDTDGVVEKIVKGWKMRAGMLPPPEAKPKPEETEDTRDLAVESIFRAYTKLDPDQRIELKQKIMAFEKSYKDPFAPKTV